MPAWPQASISVGLMGRDASEMSVSPAQNFLKPPPVPEMPTVIRAPGFAFWDSSATACLVGGWGGPLPDTVEALPGGGPSGGGPGPPAARHNQAGEADQGQGKCRAT